jgi:hypothetical protein
MPGIATLKPPSAEENSFQLVALYSVTGGGGVDVIVWAEAPAEIDIKTSSSAKRQQLFERLIAISFR